MVFDGLNPRQHEGLDAFVDNLAAVFGRKHNVIVAGKDTMRLTAIHSWHKSYDTTRTTCSARQMRGNASSHGLTAEELQRKH